MPLTKAQIEEIKRKIQNKANEKTELSEGTKADDLYQIALKINEEIASGEIKTTFEEAMQRFSFYEKKYALEEQQKFGKEVLRLQNLRASKDLSEKEKEIIEIEYKAKYAIMLNVMLTKEKIDYSGEKVVYYDDDKLETLQSSLAIVGAINDIRKSGDVEGLTKENVMKLAELHLEYADKYGDCDTLSPNRCLKIASGESVNRVPVLDSWYKSFRLRLLSEGIETEQDMSRVKIYNFDKEDGTMDVNSFFVLPNEDDYYAIQYLFERAKNNEVVIEGKTTLPGDFMIYGVDENGAAKEVDVKKLSATDPEFEQAEYIAKYKEHELNKAGKEDGLTLPEVTEEQFRENVQKIRDAEKLIQKYAKGYKLSDFEVNRMARNPNRQRVSKQCRLNMSERKASLDKKVRAYTYETGAFARIIAARKNTNRPIEDYYENEEKYQDIDQKNYGFEIDYSRPGKKGEEFRKKELISIFSEMMSYKPSDFMHKKGDLLCDMTPEKRKMAHIITEDQFMSALKKNSTNIDIDSDLLNQIDERRNLLMEQASLEILLSDTYESKFGAYIDFDKLEPSDMEQIISTIKDELHDLEKEEPLSSDRNELLTAVSKYSSYLEYKTALKPCEVSDNELKKQQEADKKLEEITVTEDKFTISNREGHIRYNSVDEDYDLFAKKMSELDEKGEIVLPIKQRTAGEDGNGEYSYVDTKFTYSEAIANYEEILANQNELAFEKLAKEIDDFQNDLGALNEKTEEYKVLELEIKAKEKILNLVTRTRFDQSEYKNGDLAVNYDSDTYRELQKNLSIVATINEIKKENQIAEENDLYSENFNINAEAERKNKLTVDYITERATRRFNNQLVQLESDTISPAKVFRIVNGEQAHRSKAVNLWFSDFKKHLKEKGIDINNKADLMKIKVCSIPNFEKGDDMEAGELKYPCSDMDLAPKNSEIEKYNELNAKASEQGKLLFQTAEAIKKATKEGKIKEAEKFKAIYNKQVEDAKKAQQDLSEFKANTFGKFHEDLVNSMSFPKDDEYEKIDKLFEAAQKKELFIEDDPLKEGEYHMVYADKAGAMRSTPIANQMKDKDPMQVDMMNLDKAKSFGAAFNGKIYDQSFCIARTEISNTIKAESKSMIVANEKGISVKKDSLKNFIYKDEEEALDHDSKRYDKHIQNAKLAEKMLGVSKSLEYQKTKLESLKEIVENTADKVSLSMLNKEALHYGAVKDLMHYASMLNSGKKLNNEETADMQEKLATLCVMREYKIGKPQEYGKASPQEVLESVQKLNSYQGFKEACKDIRAEKLIDIVDGAAAKEFSKTIYQNVQKMDKVEKPEHIKKIEEKDTSFAEKKPNMPFI